jgi:hypothetical protein
MAMGPEMQEYLTPLIGYALVKLRTDQRGWWHYAGALQERLFTAGREADTVDDLPQWVHDLHREYTAWASAQAQRPMKVRIGHVDDGEIGTIESTPDGLRMEGDTERLYRMFRVDIRFMREKYGSWAALVAAQPRLINHTTYYWAEIVQDEADA